MPKTADPLTSKDGKKLTSLYLDMFKQLDTSWKIINKEAEKILKTVRRYHAFRDAAENGDDIHDALYEKHGSSNLSLIRKWNKVYPVITTGKGEIKVR